MSLREYFEKMYKQGNTEKAYLKCSTQINPSGYMRIKHMNSSWTVWTDCGPAYSCSPNEDVYFAACGVFCGAAIEHDARCLDGRCWKDPVCNN